MRYNKNPETYPCYKVIADNGKIGGYSGTGGIHGKVQKLKDDGIEIIDGNIGEEYIILECDK